MKDHTLQSVTVDGTPVQLANNNTIKYNCVLVADSAEGLDRLPQDDNNCIDYATTSLPNKDFAYGGNLPVKFNFDTGAVEVTATVSAPTLASGQVDREN